MAKPLERVRAAWATGDRMALHREVEQLAAEGFSQQTLEDALEALLRGARAAGADEETEEVINGVWDRLTGWCDPDRQIRILPAPLLSDKELAKLPRWAVVAFAARCARRVLPMFFRNWPDAPQRYAMRLIWAVEVGEKSAARAGTGDDWAPPAGALTCAVYVCDAVNNARLDRNRAVEVINATRVAIEKFKDQPENIIDHHLGALFHALTSHAAGAIANGIATSRETYDIALSFANSIILRDFDHLVRLAEAQKWTNDTPVPPSIFGAMWPENSPSGWSAELHHESERITPSGETARKLTELISSHAA